MSWELATFLVLGVVLVGGFAWYERSRPPSQIVALVAVLAALGVAGRLLFAAIPNVVATTDIVLFTGYAIGGAPGFAVGALSGLISNFWLGQGPWTPWQMAGWGMTGVLGAWLCVVTRGHAGRVTLAAACGLAAVAYGALLNFSLMASYGGDLTLERFLTLEARAIPFDAAHAIGNVALALAAGPAMVRMLVRFRERFEWRRAGAPASVPPSRRGVLGGGIAAALVVALCLVAPAHAGARASSSAVDVKAAARYLASVQNADGGFGSSAGDGSSVAITGWVMLGLEAAGHNPRDIRAGGETPVSYLAANSRAIGSTGDIARTILALVGAGVEPRDFAGRNLIEQLRSRMRKDGSWEGWPNTTAFSVIALRAAGSRKGLRHSLTWLHRSQNDDGGWGVVPGAASDADTTGAVMQALGGLPALRRGIRYLRRAQVQGGGYRLGGGGVVNSQSTAWAVQGMIGAAFNPGSISVGGDSGLDYLARRQAADGHIRYSRQSDQTPVWVTGEALVAAAGESYPIAVVPRKPAQPKDNGNPSDVTTTPNGSSTVTPPPSGTFPATPLPSSGNGAPAVGAPLPAPAGSQAKVAPGARVGGAAETETAPRPKPGPPPAGIGPAPTKQAIGIAGGLAFLALGGTWLLGRRRGW